MFTSLLCLLYLFGLVFVRFCLLVVVCLVLVYVILLLCFCVGLDWCFACVT